MIFTDDANHAMLDDNGYPLEAHTDAQGNFTLHIHAPGQWQAGAHIIRTTDEAEKLSVSTRIVLQPSTATSPTASNTIGASQLRLLQLS